MGGVLVVVFDDGDMLIVDMVVVGIGIELVDELVCDVGFVVECGIVVNV